MDSASGHREAVMVFPHVVYCVADPLPIEFAQLCTYDTVVDPETTCELLYPPMPVGIVKKVRFNEDENVRTFEANRLDNVCPKETLPFELGEDVSIKARQSELYEDEMLLQLKENKLANTFPDKSVCEALRQTKILSSSEVTNLRAKNYTHLNDPIGFVTSELLLGNDLVITKYPKDVVMDCIINIMEIIGIISEMNTFCVIYYKGPLSVCNRPGKNQKITLERELARLALWIL
jgi:hypothetical protein